eukprot:gene19929-26635_t
MPSSITELQNNVAETERLGEEFLNLRQENVELDRHRQDLREGLTALRKQLRKDPNAGKVWIQRKGGVMLKMGAQTAISLMETDQKEIESRFTLMRLEEKILLSKLAERGALPSEAGPGMLGAMLNLRDNRQTLKSLAEENSEEEGSDSDDED